MKKSIRYISIIMSMLLATAFCSGCGKKQNAEQSNNAPSGDKPYIAVIAKGFQHKFWQTVREGAEKAAKDLDIQITFEGPDTEAQIDKQV